ncbi:MAG: hypothetical protein ACFNUP_05240 [Leptotrichia hofstadii]
MVRGGTEGNVIGGVSGVEVYGGGGAAGAVGGFCSSGTGMSLIEYLAN